MVEPRLSIYSHHSSRQGERLKRWRRQANKALPACIAAAKGLEAPIRTLASIEVSLVTDEAIAKVHGKFLDDPTPTDVITFHHGEILVSLDTAQRQSASHGETIEREVLLYIIHGLLHLAGWNDHDDSERAEMHKLQSKILDLTG